MQSISMAVQSVPTSPVSKMNSVHPKANGTASATNFFTFKWLFRGSKGSSKKKLKQINAKTKEKFATISSNTTKKLLRQSYSFDDIQNFGKAHNKNDQICKQNETKNANIYKSSLEIENNKKQKNSTQFKCKLCLADKPTLEMHAIWSCGCPFCKQCLTQYCEMSIREGKVALITCPDGSCPHFETKTNLIIAREIKLLVSAELFETYKRFRLNWMIEKDPTRTWCPTPNCETICYIRRTKAKDTNKPISVFCSTCSKSFCSSCRKAWHSGIDCKKFNAQEEVLLNESSPIKRCPKCCILIERDEGCAQIMCRNCKHVFCWYCLASLDDDFLLRHYDKGQCKDKLGHSRASVIWHRTQVVGIFAGFGLLILLASPMFILAAPCLLCCKCNSWFKTDEQMNEDLDRISNSDIVFKSDSIL